MKYAIVLAVLAVGCTAPAAQPKATPVAVGDKIGRFDVVGVDASPRVSWSMVPDGQRGVWRLNAETGDLQHCTLGGDSEVHCWRAPLPAANEPNPFRR